MNRSSGIAVILGAFAIATSLGIEHQKSSPDINRAWTANNSKMLPGLNNYASQKLKDDDFHLNVEITQADVDRLIEAKKAVAQKSSVCCTNVAPAEVDYSFQIKTLKPSYTLW